jgi:hypothetical protein
MSSIKDRSPFAATGFRTATEQFDLALNPVLDKVGVKSLRGFLEHLTGYLREIPELGQVAAAAAKIDTTAVLSGGSARAIVAAFLKDIAEEGRADVRPKRSLFEMLEGSDVDVLVIKDSGRVPEKDLQTLTQELNRISGALLVDPLPSVDRRLYTAEWDIVDARAFADLNKAFGGDTTSMFGLGLTADQRNLLVYDPEDALEKVFRGRIEYVKGENSYQHDMVVRGQFDPSLDGLRVIRMAGQMAEVGVALSPEAEHGIKELGDEAHRRAWEVQARLLHSPGGKLKRRWAKYVKKVWVDHRDPAYARNLLVKTGYLELLTLLGMRDYTLHELPAKRPDAASALPQMQQLVRDHKADLAKAIVTLDGETPLHTWQSHSLASAMLEENRSFGQDAGRLGPGLYVGSDTLPEGAVASQLLEVVPAPGTKVLDVEAAKGVVTSIVEDARPAYEAQNDGDVKPLGDLWRSQALQDLYTALGVDGGKDESGAVLTNSSAIAAFKFVRDLAEGLVEQLKNKKLGLRTEHGVRALLASRGQAGFAELQTLMKSGAVTLAQLFPEGGAPGGLFRDVPTVEPEFAAFLALELVSSRGLSPMQKESVTAAIDYLRGGLPEELQALSQVPGAQAGG